MLPGRKYSLLANPQRIFCFYSRLESQEIRVKWNILWNILHNLNFISQGLALGLQKNTLRAKDLLTLAPAGRSFDINPPRDVVSSVSYTGLPVSIAEVVET